VLESGNFGPRARGHGAGQKKATERRTAHDDSQSQRLRRGAASIFECRSIFVDYLTGPKTEEASCGFSSWLGPADDPEITRMELAGGSFAALRPSASVITTLWALEGRDDPHRINYLGRSGPGRLK